MKIEGLIFSRINEEYEYFRKLTVKDREEISEDEEHKIIKDYEDRILDDSLQKLYDRYPTFYKAYKNNQDIISKEMEESFRYFFAYLHIADNVFETCRKYFNNAVVDAKYKFIVSQYGLLMRVADQIGVMLLNGYPDGALRIWRSFYEYGAVTLLFIRERENDELHRKFIDHFYRSKKRKFESHQKNFKDLKFPPLEENFESDLQKKIEEFNTTYGRDFLDDEYGWCSDVFKLNRRVTLRDIEEHVGIKRLRPFYIWASGYTHPGFESMLDFFLRKRNKN